MVLPPPLMVTPAISDMVQREPVRSNTSGSAAANDVREGRGVIREQTEVPNSPPVIVNWPVVPVASMVVRFAQFPAPLPSVKLVWKIRGRSLGRRRR